MVKMIEGSLIIHGDLQSREVLTEVLGVFEDDPMLAPTRWGSASGLRDPYDRERIISFLEKSPDRLKPNLIRTRAPNKYAAEWYSSDVAGSFSFDSRGDVSAGEAEFHFDVITRLASKVPLEWGHVNVSFEGQEQDTCMSLGGSGVHLGGYSDFGPTCLFPRTILGPRLLSLMEDRSALTQSGLHMGELDNGAVYLDLVDSPWASDPQTLKDAQTRAHEVLSKTGIFAVPNGRYSYVPGPRWEPLDLGFS